MEKRRLYMDYSATTPAKKRSSRRNDAILYRKLLGTHQVSTIFGREAKTALDKV